MRHLWLLYWPWLPRPKDVHCPRHHQLAMQLGCIYLHLEHVSLGHLATFIGSSGKTEMDPGQCAGGFSKYEGWQAAAAG